MFFKKSILICYQFIGKFNIFIVNLFTDNHIIVNVTTDKEELMSAILLFVYYLFSISYIFFVPQFFHYFLLWLVICIILIHFNLFCYILLFFRIVLITMWMLIYNYQLRLIST